MTRGPTDAELRRLDELFDLAADLPPAEHARFLERYCAADDALRPELERLLAGLAGEDIVAQLQVVAPLSPGTRIGPYEVLEAIGEGGMGEVYAARQLEPVERRVALKVIKAGMDSAEVVARFAAERQALARMGHPFIAQVFDGGTTDKGRPYFVMEHVEGEPINEYCDRRRLSTRERVALFVDVCAGVQHAHQKGVLHRDLKPSNLLVADQDGRATPKIIDFGVARALTGRLSERTQPTLLGQVVGTPDYMSPEQADPSGPDVDTRTDIYALGVVLYQLVSGLLPFDRGEGGASATPRTTRAARDESLPTPSERLRRASGTVTRIAPLHGTDEQALVRQMRGDLDWICLKALDPEPERRYESASELAADLRRHLAHEPVHAGPPGAIYRTRRFLRRNRGKVIAVTLVTGAALVGSFGLLTGRLVARAQKPQADLYGLRQLEARAAGLWPAEPERIEELEGWIADADELLAGLDGHRAELVRLRRRAISPAEGELAPASSALAGRLGLLEAEVASARTILEDVAADRDAAPDWSDEDLTQLRAAIERREEEARRLCAERDARRTWRFESVAETSRHATLSSLVDGLEALGNEEGGLLGADVVSASFGWSVPRRLDHARRCEPGGQLDADWAVAWDEARGAIARHEDYGGLQLDRQVGLVPLGVDPDSGLWLFWHVASGARPGLDPDGRVVMSGESGLVMVLIPGGEFWMGAQSSDVRGHNYDLASRRFQRESPVTRVTLDGFFLSKFEMTQAQWTRIAGSNPSLEQWGMLLFHTPVNPVNSVTWDECVENLHRLDLELPSEEQWEYAARAGTETVWWTGDEVASLQGAANLRDLNVDGLQSGTRIVAKATSHAPNPWGLHNVHGNVWEWCRDRPYLYGSDPDSDPSTYLLRACRGGGKRTGPQVARSATRHRLLHSTRLADLGLRPSRPVRR